MKVVESLRVALSALLANKLRAALTMLGVVIGVAAVISLMSLGRGAQTQITEQVQSLGTNLLFISPGQQRQQGNVRQGAGNAQTLSIDDATAIRNEISPALVANVVAERGTGGQLIANGQNVRTRILGVTPGYDTVRNYTVAEGSFITDSHNETRARVIVLGAGVAEQLFGEGDPLDQTIRVSTNGRSGATMRVIGVLEPKGGNLTNLDDQVFVPFTTVGARLQPARTARAAEQVSSITVAVTDENLMDDAIEQIADLLRRAHRVSEDDFVISSQRDFLQSLSQITGLMTAFLGAIAGISLVVGGIGIMNIMLVSVTERTREIGIRKAVGARARDILSQFLVEAVTVSLLGGLTGIAVGVGISRLVSQLELNGRAVPSIVAPDAALLAFTVSAAVGLFFGIYPAMRAARLNPIEALRYE
jgi:putative ABC transport system permease protein